LVVRSGKSRRGQVQQAANRLREVRANLIGIVFNRLPARAEGYNTLFYYAEAYGESDEDQTDGGSDNVAAKGKLRRRFQRNEGKQAIGESS
jgi:Mrp family chromosome partitioning ATPase